MANTTHPTDIIEKIHNFTAANRWGVRRRARGRIIQGLFLAVCVTLLTDIVPLRAQEHLPPTPYEAVLTRLEAMSVVPLSDWKAHYDDVAHGEDPTLDDSAWAPLQIGEHWGQGPSWFRRWVEIPPALGGYDIRGARIRLDLLAGGEWASQVRVFFNGSLVEMTQDDNNQQPIVLTQKAEPGLKVLVAINNPLPTGPTWLNAAAMLVDYPQGRPDPGLIANEIRSADALMSASPGGQSQRREQLDAAVKAINFASLDRGDAPAFEKSLQAAQEKLNPLGDWAKQFTIHAVGNRTSIWRGCGPGRRRWR